MWLFLFVHLSDFLLRIIEIVYKLINLKRFVCISLHLSIIWSSSLKNYATS